MKIFEFIDKYCSDILQEFKERSDMFDLAEFPHDDIIVDEFNNQVPVVYIDSIPVPIADIITSTKEDFLKAYKLPSAEESYTNYLDAFVIIEGEEAVARVRKRIAEEAQRLQQGVDIMETVW